MIKRQSWTQFNLNDAITNPLNVLLTDLSEELLWANWASDLEFSVWRWLKDGWRQEYDFPGSRRYEMTAEAIDSHLEEIRRFTTEQGWWPLCPYEEWPRCYKVPVAEWDELYASE